LNAPGHASGGHNRWTEPQPRFLSPVQPPWRGTLDGERLLTGGQSEKPRVQRPRDLHPQKDAVTNLGVTWSNHFPWQVFSFPPMKTFQQALPDAPGAKRREKGFLPYRF
jgi:hypothetical protein